MAGASGRILAVCLAVAGSALVADRASAVATVSTREGTTQDASGARDENSRVRRIVERVVREPQSLDEASREIGRLGPSALVPMFAELETAVAGTAPSGERARLVLALFHALPADATLGFLAGSVAEDSPAGARRAAVSLLGELGRASDCTRLLALTRVTEGDDEGGSELEQALARLLARHCGPAHDALDAKLRDTEPALYPYIARAVGAAGSPRGLESLRRLLGLEPAVDDVVLSEIVRIAEPMVPPFDHSTVEEVRDCLDASKAQVRAAAASAAGALADHEAVRTLVDLMADDAPAVRDAAYAALGEITGLEFRADQRPWKTWLAQELTWWEHDAESTFEGLGSDEVARVFASIGAMSAHRLYRQDLVRELAPLLNHREARVRQFACIGLAQLGSATALPLLDACLEDDDELVRQSARSTIDRLARKESAPGA